MSIDSQLIIIKNSKAAQKSYCIANINRGKLQKLILDRNGIIKVHLYQEYYQAEKDN